jgi:predicted dehydrogenase
MTRRTFLMSAAATIRLPKKTRVAIIGVVGHIGDVTQPLPRLPDVEIAGVYDSDREAAARLLRNPNLKGAKLYDDYRRMLDVEKPDIAAVCNDNGARAAGILAALERGMHVIAEKPLALKMSDLDQIEKMLAAKKLKLSMLVNMRTTPHYQAMHRIVQSGEIGEVAQITSQKSYQTKSWPAWRSKRSTYGGTMPWIGIHMVDLMRWISGREFTEAASYEAHIGFPQLGEMENSTATIFRLDNGGVASLRMDYLRPDTAPTHGDDRIRMAGTKGVVEYQAATGLTLMTANKKPEKITEMPEERSLFVEFLESIYHDKPAWPAVPDIFRTCRIVLEAQRAAVEHRIVAL